MQLSLHAPAPEYVPPLSGRHIHAGCLCRYLCRYVPTYPALVQISRLLSGACRAASSQLAARFLAFSKQLSPAGSHSNLYLSKQQFHSAWQVPLHVRYSGLQVQTKQWTPAYNPAIGTLLLCPAPAPALFLSCPACLSCLYLVLVPPSPPGLLHRPLPSGHAPHPYPRPHPPSPLC